MLNPSAYPPSYYAATSNDVLEHPVLTDTERADVCVIGGGFTGLSAALNLAEQGMDYDQVVEQAKKIAGGPPKFSAEAAERE